MLNIYRDLRTQNIGASPFGPEAWSVFLPYQVVLDALNVGLAVCDLGPQVGLLLVERGDLVGDVVNLVLRRVHLGLLLRLLLPAMQKQSSCR
jgi:hypothetical protein